MTMSATDSKIRYAYSAPGVVAFAIPFTFYDTDEVEVYLRDETATDPYDHTESLLIYGAGAGKYQISGTTLTLGTALAASHVLVIRRALPLEQTLDGQPGVPIANSTLEQHLDKIVAQGQDQAEAIERAIKFKKSSDQSIEIPDPLEDGVFVWNSAGTGLEYKTVSELGISAPDVEYSGGTVEDELLDLQTQITANDAATAAALALKTDETAFQAHLIDSTDAHDASAISVTPAGSMGSTDVQAALVEILGDLETHVADPVDAHDATAVSFAPTGNTTSTTVQAAIVELQGDINALTAGAATSADNVTYDDTASGSGTADVQAAIDDLYFNVVGSLTAISDHTDGSPSKHQASEIDNTPSGNLAAGTVQGALDELQTSIDGIAAQVDDTIYGAGWNADTTHAPSKNAVYDKIEAVVATIPTVSDTAYAGSWDGVTTVAPSKNAVYDKIETVQSSVDGLNTFSAQYIQNLGLACSVASNALTIALKQADGSTNPAAAPANVKIAFRNTTITTGAYNVRSVAAALSVVVSSGSTLGHGSTSEHKIWVYAIDNAGTVELAVSTTKLDEGKLYTTTAEGGAGAADSGSALYSTTARANVPIRLIGRLKSTQTTAGTWAAAPTEVLTNPAALAMAVDRVAARYNASAAFTTGTSSGRMAWNTKEFDTHGCVTPGGTSPNTTWLFTAPRAGFYRAYMAAVRTASAGSDGPFYMRISGTGATGNHWTGNTTGNNGQNSGSTLFYLPAGGTFYVDQGTGSANNFANDSTNNWVAIESIE